MALPSSGHRSAAWVIALAFAGAALPASAQTRSPTNAANEAQRPQLLTRLIDCRSIADPGARLACYDSAATALDSAERQGDVVVVDRAQVRTARRELFGFELPSSLNLFERGAEPERLDSIETTLTSAREISRGTWSFRLADGSTWVQIDTQSAGTGGRPGDAVRVRRAAMGSYMLAVGRNPAVRVKRQ